MLRRSWREVDFKTEGLQEAFAEALLTAVRADNKGRDAATGAHAPHVGHTGAEGRGERIGGGAHQSEHVRGRGGDRGDHA